MIQQVEPSVPPAGTPAATDWFGNWLRPHDAGVPCDVSRKGACPTIRGAVTHHQVGRTAGEVADNLLGGGHLEAGKGAGLGVAQRGTRGPGTGPSSLGIHRYIGRVSPLADFSRRLLLVFKYFFPA